MFGSKGLNVEPGSSRFSADLSSDLGVVYLHVREPSETQSRSEPQTQMNYCDLWSHSEPGRLQEVSTKIEH